MPDLQTMIAVIVEAQTEAAEERLTALNDQITSMGAVMEEGGARAEIYGRALNAMASAAAGSVGATKDEVQALGEQFVSAFTKAQTAQNRVFLGTDEMQAALKRMWEEAVKGANAYNTALQSDIAKQANFASEMDATIAKLSTSTNRAMQQSDQMLRDVNRRASEGANDANTAWTSFGSRAGQSMMGLNAALVGQRGLLGEVGQAAGNFAFQLMLAGNYASTIATRVATIGAGMSALGGIGIAAAAPYTMALGRLDNALQNVDSSLAEHRKEIDKTISTGEKLGHSSSDTVTAMERLVTGFHDAGAGEKYFADVADLAAAKQVSLAEAATMFVRFIEGHYSRGMKDLLPTFQFTIDKTKDLEAAQEQLVRATERVSQAEQHLAELQTLAQQRSEEKAMAVDKETQANERLAQANQSLQDTLDRQAASAADRADTIAKAHTKEREALNSYNEELQHFTSLSQVTQGDVERMQAAMKKRDAAAVGASGAAGGESNVQQVNDRIQLRDAQDAVSKAVKDVADAHALATAKANDLTTADIALRKASEEVAKAKEAEGAVNRRIAEDQAAVQQRAGDTERALAALEGVIGGRAKAQADTFGGTVKRIQKEITDFLAEHGAKWGTALAGLGGGLQVLGGIMNIFKGSAGGASVAMGEAGIAAEGAGAAIGIGTMLAGGAIILLGVALTAFLLHNERWTGWMKAFGANLNNWWHDAADILRSIPDWIMEHVIGPLERFPQNMYDGIMKANDWLMKLGGDIVGGIWDGINKAGSWLAGAVMDFVKDHIKDPILHFFGINSPSTVMAEAGANMVIGLARGLQSEENRAAAAATAVANRVSGAFAYQNGMRAMSIGMGTPGTIQPAGGGGPSSVTYVSVAGSLLTERELIDKVQKGASQDAFRNGNWLPARVG